MRKLADVAVTSGATNRSKPFCRMMGAEACAFAGNFAGARDHLGQLVKVGPDVSYYRLGGVTEIAWKQIASRQELGEDLKEGEAEVPKLSKVGRTSQILAIRYAAACVAGGKTSVARGLIEQIHDAHEESQFAMRMAIAMNSSDLNLDRCWTQRPVVALQFPHTAAVSALLSLHQQSAIAKKWALESTAPQEKIEALAAWAEFSAPTISPAEKKELATDQHKLGPVGAAFVLARLAVGETRANLSNQATDSLTRALDQLKDVAVPPVPAIPSVKILAKPGSAEQNDFLHRWAAAAEVGQAQALAGKTAEAEKSLDLALEMSRGMGVPHILIAPKIKELDDWSAGQLRGWISQQLGLKSDEQARVAAANYRRAIREIFESSSSRTESQRTILSRCLEMGKANWVAKKLREAAESPMSPVGAEVANRELLTHVLKGLQMVNSDQIADIQELLGKSPEGSVGPFVPEFLQAVDRDDARQISALLQPMSVQTREMSILRAVSRGADEVSVKRSAKLITLSKEVSLREEAGQILSEIAARNGQIDYVWKTSQEMAQSTERAAWMRGLVAAITATQKPPAKSL